MTSIQQAARRPSRTSTRHPRPARKSVSQKRLEKLLDSTFENVRILRILPTVLRGEINFELSQFDDWHLRAMIGDKDSDIMRVLRNRVAGCRLDGASARLKRRRDDCRYDRVRNGGRRMSISEIANVLEVGKSYLYSVVK
jgi:hypothetical protein